METNMGLDERIEHAIKLFEGVNTRECMSYEDEYNYNAAISLLRKIVYDIRHKNVVSDAKTTPPDMRQNGSKESTIARND